MKKGKKNMTKYSELCEIEKLIKKGFDLELISFELDIPLKEIQQLHKIMKNQEKPTNNEENNHRKKTNNKELMNKKIEQMRERYQQLFFENNKKDNIAQIKVSEEETKQINLCISTIEEKIEEMKALPKREKRKIANEIISKMKEIQNYPLTIEQAEKLNFLLKSEELKRLSLDPLDKIDIIIYRYRKIMFKKLSEALDIAQCQTEDIEELNRLGRKITLEMQKENLISVNTVKSRIDTKVSKILQKQAIERIKNDMSENILGIIEDLVNGTLDMENAHTIIEEEAEKKLEKNPKNKFSLTKEQEERQILMKINMTIRDKADKFQIVDPEITILQLQELTQAPINQVIRTVVENLVSRKKFEEAKGICNEFLSKNKKGPFAIEMKDLKLRIRNAQIGDTVLKIINNNASEEEPQQYIELIEKEIEKGTIKLGAISLGKSQDGMRSIRLSDIWSGKSKNQKEK